MNYIRAGADFTNPPADYPMYMPPFTGITAPVT